MGASIVSTAIAVPDLVESSSITAEKIGKSVEWVCKRTGVAERYVAKIDDQIENLAAVAAHRALCGKTPEALINASVSTRQLLPDLSVFIQRALGFDGVPCFSVNANCLSFLVALKLAHGLIASGTYRSILLVSAEFASRARNYAEPESAALLGDGAGSALISYSPDKNQSMPFFMYTWSDGAEATEIRSGGLHRHPSDPRTTDRDYLFSMNGPELFKLGNRKAVPAIKEFLHTENVEPNQIDVVIPHQASRPAIDVLLRIGFREDQIVSVIDRYGNCVAASIPIALAHAEAEGRLKPGKKIFFVGTAAGFSVGGALWTW
jgi:3-oxoacyl-[acyl-carrier-protein] synthase-3